MRKSISTAVLGGVTALVASLFVNAQPISAQELIDGKTIVVSGIPGCDCTEEAKECYCKKPKEDN